MLLCEHVSMRLSECRLGRSRSPVASRRVASVGRPASVCSGVWPPPTASNLQAVCRRQEAGGRLLDFDYWPRIPTIPTTTPCSMAYREAYCTHLPSPTTLYSGARVCSSLSETQPVHASTRKYHLHHPPHQREVRVVSRFATAQQSIEVGSIAYRRIPAEGGEGEVVNFTYDCYEGDRLPRGPQHLNAGAGAEMLGDAEDATDPLTCVAHSCLPHSDNANDNKSSSGGMEAFILRRIDSSSAGTTTDASTVAEGGSSDRQPKQHRRHVSGSGSAGASSLRMVDSLESMTIDSITGLDASSTRMAGMGSTPPNHSEGGSTASGGATGCTVALPSAHIRAECWYLNNQVTAVQATNCIGVATCHIQYMPYQQPIWMATVSTKYWLQRDEACMCLDLVPNRIMAGNE